MSEFSGSANDPFQRLAVTAFLVGLLALIWYFMFQYMDDELRHVWRLIRTIELSIWWVVAHVLHPIGFGLSPEQLERQIQFLLNPPGGNVAPAAIAQLNRGWGSIWAPWITAFFFLKGISLYVRRRNLKLPHDMEGLLKYYAGINKKLGFFVKNNPYNFSIEYSPYGDNRFAQRVTPWDFVRMSPPPLLDTIDKDPFRSAGPIFDPSKPRDNRFNYELCYTVLSYQMGQRTQGKKTFSQMTETERKVFKILQKGVFGGKKQTARIIANHAYIRTALLELAFNSSTQMAHLQWVKYEDRTLFYCLQDCGMEVCSAESAGPWFHWQAERITGKPIHQPAVDLAVQGFANLVGVDEETLKQYLKDEQTLRQDPYYWENERNKAVSDEPNDQNKKQKRTRRKRRQ